jgi:hypothetical protein
LHGRSLAGSVALALISGAKWVGLQKIKMQGQQNNFETNASMKVILCNFPA